MQDEVTASNAMAEVAIVGPNGYTSQAWAGDSFFRSESIGLNGPPTSTGVPGKGALSALSA